MKRIALLIVGLVAFLAIESSAQLGNFYQPLGTEVTRDTVTNSGTAYVTTPLIKAAPATSTTVWVSVTKISGTVGGTISLQGSFDGTNWKALNTPNTQTALATITATDASNTYHWILSGSPFPYYRVTWTGTGTMSASFVAQFYRAK